MSEKLNLCPHNTLHFEGKRLRYIVCVCGKRWERHRKYKGNMSITILESINNGPAGIKSC